MEPCRLADMILSAEVAPVLVVVGAGSSGWYQEVRKGVVSAVMVCAGRKALRRRAIADEIVVPRGSEGEKKGATWAVFRPWALTWVGPTQAGRERKERGSSWAGSVRRPERESRPSGPLGRAEERVKGSSRSMFLKVIK